MLYVPDNLDGATPTTDQFTSIPQPQNVYYSDQTLKRQSVESESSFDSGYFSPMASGRPAFAPVAQQQPAYTSSMVQQSPSKIALMASVIDELTSSKPLHSDLPMLDDWDKNFIENFEENLFSLDTGEDLGLLEGFFKSPMKSPLRILSPAKGHGSRFSPHKMAYKSPYKNSYVRSPYKRASYSGYDNKMNVRETMQTVTGRTGGKSIASAFSQQTNSTVEQTEASNVFAPTILAEKKQPHAYVGTPLTNISGSSQKRIKFDSRTTSHRQSNRKTKENNEPFSSKQKLQMARANFRLSLEKAVETAATRSTFRKSDQYPQLSKALSKPSTATAASPTFEIESSHQERCIPSDPSPTFGNPYLEEDAEIPSSWLGGAGSEVGAYEVEPQAGCKVVIRKRKK